MEELKELEQNLNTSSFCNEWMDKVVSKVKFFIEFDPVSYRETARKLMRLILTTTMLQRMNYAGCSSYVAENGKIERKFKLKYSRLFAVLVLIMKQLGFKDFDRVKEAILNLVYKSRTNYTKKPENSGSKGEQRGSKKRRGSKRPKLQADQITENESFPKIATIREVKDLEHQLKHESYFTQWTDDIVGRLEIYSTPVCGEIARHLMKLVFAPCMWLRMNYAGKSQYDPGDGILRDKFKLKKSRVFNALMSVMKRLGFKIFLENKHAILNIVYKSNVRVPAKSAMIVPSVNSISVTEPSSDLKSKQGTVTEHSEKNGVNSKHEAKKSIPTKQRNMTEHLEKNGVNSKYETKKSKSAKQRTVSEHSEDEGSNSNHETRKSKRVKQKVMTEHSETEGENSEHETRKSKRVKQKVITEHSETEGENSEREPRKSKRVKQKVMTEHSETEGENSEYETRKSKRVKQKVMTEHSETEGENSEHEPRKSKRVKQKVMTEHSETEGENSEQETRKSKHNVVSALNCSEEILFGNFELATSECSTAIESSSNIIVTDNIEPADTIYSTVEQVLNNYFENTNV